MKKLIALAMCMVICISALAFKSTDTYMFTQEKANIANENLLNIKRYDENEYSEEDTDDVATYAHWLCSEAMASSEYEERKADYQQYAESVFECIKRPEVKRWIDVAASCDINDVNIYLQDYTLDDVPELVLGFHSNVQNSDRCVVFDLKTGAVLNVFYNNTVFIGVDENNQKFIFVEEAESLNNHFKCRLWSRLKLTDENHLVRDKYLFIQNLYRENTPAWLPVEEFFVNIQLEVGNGYKQYFLNSTYIPLENMPQNCKTNSGSLVWLLKTYNTKCDLPICIGQFKSEYEGDKNVGKLVFHAEAGFECIKKEMNEWSENIKTIRIIERYPNYKVIANRDFFALRVWDEYAYLYEG